MKRQVIDNVLRCEHVFLFAMLNRMLTSDRYFHMKVMLYKSKRSIILAVYTYICVYLINCGDRYKLFGTIQFLEFFLFCVENCLLVVCHGRHLRITCNDISLVMER